MCKHACAWINDVKAIIQNSYVRTRRVHDSLQTDVCLSGTHMPNLDYVHANCEPRTAELPL